MGEKCDLETFSMWKVFKYEPEKTPYLDTFHAVIWAQRNPNQGLTNVL